jgi:hypothetical protein
MPPFNKILVRDKGSKGDVDGRKKKQATKELAFVWFWANPVSPYYEYDLDQKTFKIKRAVGLDDSWKMDNAVTEAIDFYISEFIENKFALRTLNSNINAINKTNQFLDDFQYSERDDKNKPLYTPAMITTAVKNCTATLLAVEATRERVLKSMSMVPEKAKGGHDKGDDEDPEEDY